MLICIIYANLCRLRYKYRYTYIHNYVRICKSIKCYMGIYFFYIYKAQKHHKMQAWEILKKKKQTCISTFIKIQWHPCNFYNIKFSKSQSISQINMNLYSIVIRAQFHKKKQKNSGLISSSVPSQLKFWSIKLLEIKDFRKNSRVWGNSKLRFFM